MGPLLDTTIKILYWLVEKKEYVDTSLQATCETTETSLFLVFVGEKVTQE